MTDSSPYRALICITTCDRERYLRRYLPHFARFTTRDARFSLLVALDGDDAATRRFCSDWNVPLVFSDQREGVGISKNRALERFPDFDYYFFIEDDVELKDGEVFPLHVELSRASGIHHFSLFERHGLRKPTGESTVAGHRVAHGDYGGADFNFFTGAGLRRVGGWHPRFAQYRRWGHTEHTYRFVRAGLTPAPFNVAVDSEPACIWHAPPSVTHVAAVSLDDDQIAAPERELIDQALEFVPVQTFSEHHFNDVPFGQVERLAETLDGGDRYPLAAGTERRECWSDYHLWRFKHERRIHRRAAAFIRAAWAWRQNPAIRHLVKMAIRP